MSVTRVLVANRGEIAVRVIAPVKVSGSKPSPRFPTPTAKAWRRKMANRAVCIGPARSTDSYLKVENVIAAAQGTGCDALHPGYGFLSERAALAQACVDNKITFVGPSAENITMMGDKLEARKDRPQCRRAAGARFGSCAQSARSRPARRRHRLSRCLLKASAGGGGRGIKLVWNAQRDRRYFSHGGCGSARGVRQRHALHGTLCRQCAPYRSADPRRPAWQRDPSRRARLLAATAPSEDRRRSAGLRRAARKCAPNLHSRGDLGAQHRLPKRRHHRVHLRQRHQRTIIFSK